MSFLSAQGSNATFYDTIVHDLTINGKLTVVNDASGDTFEVPLNVTLDTIKSPDQTNEIDLSVAHQINLDSSGTIVHGDLTVLSTADSSAVGVGSVVIDGGLSVAKTFHLGNALNVAGNSALKGINTITNATDSTAVGNGALVNDGGLSVAKSTHLGGTLNVTGNSAFAGINTITNTTDSSGLGLGCMVLDGGLSVAKSMNIGGNMESTSISGKNGIVDIKGGNQLFINGSENAIANCKTQGAYIDWNEVGGTGKMNLINNRGGGAGGLSFYNVKTDASGNVANTNEVLDVDGSGNLSIYSTSNSTASSNGALIVKGGAGVAKDLYVSGNIHCSGTVSSSNSNNYTEFHYVSGGGDAQDFSGTITLNNGGQNSTNYAVFTSIYDNLPQGSGGTYNSSQTSSALHQVIIQTITKTSFQFIINKATGDNVNLTVVFMVIFSSALAYPK